MYKSVVHNASIWVKVETTGPALELSATPKPSKAIKAAKLGRKLKTI